MREQLRVGFVLSALRERLLSGEDSTYYQDVLGGLSAFELRIKNPPGAADRDDPVFKVAANLVTRGLPTLPSLRVERHLSEVTGLTEERRSLGAISFPLRQDLTGEALHLLHRALVPVDPHLEPKEVVRYRSGLTESEAERHFLRSDVSRTLAASHRSSSGHSGPSPLCSMVARTPASPISASTSPPHFPPREAIRLVLSPR